ncbi:hypothetical protein JS530_03150 [Bifidobacterium sp. LC6]|uniref:Tetratricopeptide repeat protein n=1 Tax=Bifidobacterium colobi TaxID=2809026 RepID=A0ABS5UUL8_9BIFI|nr:hypothetical protein [Bifidobacterium colobi]MBT1174515.1 hypothetical protein [Bifidobacterium colobi]
MSVQLDSQRFLDEVKHIQADFDMWREAVVPLPDAFADGLINRVYGLFGQTNPADLLVLAVQTHDDDLIEQSAGFLADTVSMIEEENVFGWMFRMIWGREIWLRQQVDELEDMDATFDFLTSACRMCAHILLTWGEDDASCAAIARLFLLEQYDEALNCLLPYAKVSLDPQESALVIADLQQRAIEAEARREEKAARHSAEESVASITPSGKREAAAEQDSDALGDGGVEHSSESEESQQSEQPDETSESAEDGLYEDGRPFPESDTLYIFDAEHTIAAYRRLFTDDSSENNTNDAADSTAGENPWDNPRFVHDKLLSLAGADVIEPLVVKSMFDGDEEQFSAALRLLDIYRGIVHDDGLLTLPIIALSTLSDSEGLKQDASLDDRMQYLETSRALCASMGAVLLARVPEPEWSRKLALALLDADIDTYIQHVRQLTESLSC